MNGLAMVLLVLTAAAMVVSSPPGQLTNRNKRATEDGDIPVAPSESPCGEEKTLCETTDLYPAEYIDKILKKSGNQYKDLLGVDELSAEVGLRANFGTEFEICRSTEQVVFPKYAKNRDDNWRFVINEGNNVQGIRAEICHEDKQSCELSETFPTGYNSSCQQKYIYRKLMILSPNGTLDVDLMKIPSSCSCFVTSPLRKKFDSAISEKMMSRPSPNKMPTQEADTPASGSQVDNVTATPTTRNCGDNSASCEPTRQLLSDLQGIVKNGTPKRDANEEYTLADVNSLNENDTTDFELCSSTQKLFTPITVQNKENEWQHVLNQHNDRPNFLVEICTGKDLPCALSENFPTGYKSSCKQKYSYHKVLTVSKNDTSSHQTIKVPSACSCVVTNTLGLE